MRNVKVVSAFLGLGMLVSGCAKTAFSESTSRVGNSSRTVASIPDSIVSTTVEPANSLLPQLIADRAGAAKLLIFVSGNAGDQSVYREKLAVKVQSLIERLGDRDVEIMITNLSTELNAQPSDLKYEGRADGGEVLRINQNDPLVKITDRQGFHTEQESSLLAKFRPFFGKDVLRTEYYNPREMAGEALKISKAQFQRDFAAVRSKITSKIMAISDHQHIDPSERDICKVTQFLADTSANAFIKAGDQVGVVLLSEKDDWSTGLYFGPENCVLTQKSVSSIYPEFTWYIGQHVNQSGTPANLIGKDNDYYVNADKILTERSSYSLPESCTASNLPDADLCTTGFYCGKDYYSNILDYADKVLGDKYKAGVCQKTYKETLSRVEFSGLPKRTWSGGEPWMGSYRPQLGSDVDYTFAFSQADITAGGMAQGFAGFAKRRFGNNIHLSVIVDPVDGACGKPGAKRYSGAATKLGRQGQVLPLCKF